MYIFTREFAACILKQTVLLLCKGQVWVWEVFGERDLL